MENEKISDEIDEEIDDFSHGRMLEAIRNLTSEKQRWATSQRTETVPVSEFSLNEDEPVQVVDLLTSLRKTAALIKVGKEVKKAKRTKLRVLPVPLEKPIVTKINRVVTYNNVCKEVSKWEKVVIQNRTAEQMVYPLDQTKIRVEANAEVVERFKLKTPLELEVQALLQQEQLIIEDDVENEDETETRQALEEATEMRQEMRRLRARMSYEEAKARYRKKIKSKRYHRILKKERMKKEVKAFQALQKTNPDLAQEKLERLDRARAVERMTFRHRNTGKWAREQILKFKDDKESGRAIQEQIKLSRQLTAKVYVPSEDEEENEAGKVETDVSSKELKLSASDASNPWMTTGSRSSLRSAPASVKEDVETKLLVGYRRYWEEQNRRHEIDEKDPSNGDEGKVKLVLGEKDNKERPGKKMKTKKQNDTNGGIQDAVSAVKKVGRSTEDKAMVPIKKLDAIFRKAENERKLVAKSKKKRNRVAKVTDTIRDEEETEEEEETDDDINETLTQKRLWEDFDHFEPETKKTKRAASRLTSCQTNEKEAVAPEEEAAAAINPHDFIAVKGKVIKCHVPAEAYDDDEAVDDGDDHRHAVDNRMTIAEAFADDDVIDEFVAEKQSTVDKDRPKDIDLTLPGWGEWGGQGVEISEAKMKKFIFKAPNGPPRKDRGLSNVIINEQADESVRRHRVATIPKQFKTAEEFEKSIAAPIGKHWNPETAFKRLIAPRVVTKLGAIIEPIDDSFLEKNQHDRKELAPRDNAMGQR